MKNNRINEIKLLRYVLSVRGELHIKVKGTSMKPTLFEGDSIRVVKDNYQIGDILLFAYENDELLVHRYVGEQGGKILCKGDNSFRLEVVETSAIVGKVDALLQEEKIYPIPAFGKSLIARTLEIGRRFQANGQDVLTTKKDIIYIEFRNDMKKYAMFRNNT